MPRTRGERIPVPPFALRRHQRNAIDRAWRDTELATAAQRREHAVHPFRCADDRIYRTCLDAERAANARVLVDTRDLERPWQTARRIERRSGSTEQCCERNDRCIAARRTAIDVHGIVGDGFRVRTATGVAAARALRLRQEVVDTIGEVGRADHDGAILGTLPRFTRTAFTAMSHRHSHDESLHAHDGDAHDHQIAPSATTMRALASALALTGGYAIVEAVGGWLAGSLALLSDAGHMATDAAALGLALFAQWVARRPPSPRASYGYARAEVLAAFVNAIALLLLVAFIVIEAVARIAHPSPVAGGAVLGIAAVGLAINLGTAWMLSRAPSSDSAHSALLHVLSDALGSVGALVAGAVILTTGWTPIDPILSLFTAALILRSTWRLLAKTTAVLMEGVPSHLDYQAIGTALTQVRGVTGVHDLHVWHMSAQHAALSAHVAIDDGDAWPRILGDARAMLASRFAIDHVTLQPSWPVGAPYSDRRVIPIAPAEGG